MLLLVYTLVKAPDVGWGAGRTVAGLAGAAVILAAFVVNELRVRNPLVPLSILKVKGVAAADATQLVAIAGFLPMFFFLTLYMQTVLGYSPIQTGLAYLPLTGGFIIAASICSQLFARIGTKPVVVAGTVISRCWPLLAVADPGRRLVPIGHPARPADRLDRMGGVFTGLTTAANAGVDQDKAGLAAGLLNTGQQLGPRSGWRSSRRSPPRRRSPVERPATASLRPRPTATSAHSWSGRSSSSRRPSSRS